MGGTRSKWGNAFKLEECFQSVGMLLKCRNAFKVEDCFQSGGMYPKGKRRNIFKMEEYLAKLDCGCLLRGSPCICRKTDRLTILPMDGPKEGKSS